MATCLVAAVGFYIVAVAAAGTKHSHQHKRCSVERSVERKEISDLAHVHPAQCEHSGAELDGEHSESFLQLKTKGERSGYFRPHRLKIPRQLILMGKASSIKDMPGPFATNVINTIKLNEDLQALWFSDDDCREYLVNYYDQELLDIFDSETKGCFRGDICRTAILANEGGFYTDVDVQWVTPMREMVNRSTTFMSIFENNNLTRFHGGLLNAVLAAEPKSAILNATLQQIRMWYSKPDTQHNVMGPETLRRALDDVLLQSCSKQEDILGFSQITCGPHDIALYENRNLGNLCQPPFSQECPEVRAKGFKGIHSGIFWGRRLVAWNRFAECTEWGCGGSGQDHADHTEHKSEGAERFQPSRGFSIALAYS